MFLLAAFGIEVYEMSEYGVTECAVNHDVGTDIDIYPHMCAQSVSTRPSSE